MRDRFHYSLEEGGYADKVLKEFNKKWDGVWNSWKDFANKYEVDNIYGNDILYGLVFENTKPPKGWISPKTLPSSVFKPARKKICLDAYNDFHKLKSLPSGVVLAKLLGIECVFDDMKMYMPGIEKIGEEQILTLHHLSEVPEGVIKLKMSEYWALKEAA